MNKNEINTLNNTPINVYTLYNTYKVLLSLGIDVKIIKYAIAYEVSKKFFHILWFS